MVRLKATPINLIILQPYMPASGHAEEEIEDMYQRLDKLLQEETRGTHCCNHGRLECSSRGRKWRERSWCLRTWQKKWERTKTWWLLQREQLCDKNTWFKQEKRRQYTWKQPGDRNRYQLDYILVKQRFQNSVLNKKTYPGADAHTYHNLVAIRIRAKLKIVYKGRSKKHWNTDSFKDSEKSMVFREKVEDKIERQQEEMNIGRRWLQLKGKI